MNRILETNTARPVPSTFEPGDSGRDDPRATRALLACGAAAGPLFALVALAHALFRAGFDPAQHPVSLLSLAGLLFVLCAVGMRRALHPGRAGTWGPWLLGAFGGSLIVGGIFVADPAFGFPPGTPEGAPDAMTWHGVLHAIAPAVGLNALVAACFVLARRFAGLGERAWMKLSLATGVTVLALSAWPNLGDPEGRFLPLWIAVVLGFGWASAVAARLRNQVGERML